MIRRFVLVVLCAFAMLAALPAATSAGPGQANGGRECETFEVTGGSFEGCQSGGRGEGGGGGRSDVELNFGGDGTADISVTSSGGEGKGGGGGRTCFTVPGEEQQCFTPGSDRR